MASVRLQCVSDFISRVCCSLPTLCALHKQNVEVSRMSEEALQTVPAHQWGSAPPSLPPSPFSRSLTPSPCITHTVRYWRTAFLPKCRRSYLLGFFFFNLLLVKLTGIQFQLLNPMTQVLCQLDSPCNGQWKKIRFIFYSLILIYWWNCEVILTSAPFSVLVCSHFFL